MGQASSLDVDVILSRETECRREVGDNAEFEVNSLASKLEATSKAHLDLR